MIVNEEKNTVAGNVVQVREGDNSMSLKIRLDAYEQNMCSVTALSGGTVDYVINFMYV